MTLGTMRTHLVLLACGGRDRSEPQEGAALQPKCLAEQRLRNLDIGIAIDVDDGSWTGVTFVPGEPRLLAVAQLDCGKAVVIEIVDPFLEGKSVPVSERGNTERKHGNRPAIAAWPMLLRLYLMDAHLLAPANVLRFVTL